MAQRKRSFSVLLAIGLFKLFKAVLLLALAIGAHRLLHRDIQNALLDWIRKIQVDPDNHFVHKVLARLTNLDERRLQAISVGTFLYGLLFAVEGAGLLMRKRWAEYLTVISTALLLPVEVYQIYEKSSPIKIAVLI